MNALSINLKGISNLVVREGIMFRRTKNRINKLETLDEDSFIKYQINRLQKVIQHSYNNIPYYNNLLNSLGLKPNDINQTEDLVKLPFMTKKDVIQNFKLLQCFSLSPKTKGYTSGTTGTPAVFIRDLNSVIYENACVWKQWNLVGMRLGDRRVTLRGDLVCDPANDKPPFWILNRAQNQLLMSSYHLCKKTANYYVKEILEFKPKIIQAYPSSIYLLALYSKKMGIKLKVNGVFTSSETLLDYQRSLIEDVCQCQVFDWYGNAERVAAIVQCNYKNYHIIPHYSIVELVERSDLNSDEREVIGTTLNNYAMPLIRYKTGDIIKLSKSRKCSCGLTFPVIENIQGRMDDYIILPDGRYIGRLDHLFKAVDNIQEAQIIQKSLNEICFKIIKDEKFTRNDEEKLKNNINKRLGTAINVKLDYVSQIDRTTSGKFRNVISEISLNDRFK